MTCSLYTSHAHAYTKQQLAAAAAGCCFHSPSTAVVQQEYDQPGIIWKKRKREKKKRVTEKRERREWILVGLHELSSRNWWGRRLSLTILAPLPVCMSLPCRPPSPRWIIDMTKLALWLFGVCRLQWHSTLCTQYWILYTTIICARPHKELLYSMYTVSNTVGNDDDDEDDFQNCTHPILIEFANLVHIGSA